MIPFLEPQEEIYLLYVGVALGAFLLITGLAQLLERGESHSEARNRRMRMLGKGATTAEVLQLLRPTPGTGWMPRLPVLGQLPREMARAGMTMAPARFLLLCTLAAVVVGALAIRVMAPLQAALLALVVAFLLPVAVVKVRRQRRLDKMVSQLPDALELMARGLKVGHPLNTSVGAVASEMPDPIGSEFGIIFDQVSYGDDLVSAFQDFADRTDVEDAHYLAVSIGIQHGTGGDLARVVDILAKTIRGRLSLRRRITAVSAEGRLSALILSAVPFALFASVTASAPGYYSDVADDPMFLPMAITCGVLVVLNALILYRLVNFRI
jgi:tight adherence protein B